jgi:hypothetical protein
MAVAIVPLESNRHRNVARLRPVWVFSSNNLKPHESPLLGQQRRDATSPTNQGIAIDVRRQKARTTGLRTTAEGWVSTYGLSHFGGQVTGLGSHLCEVLKLGACWRPRAVWSSAAELPIARCTPLTPPPERSCGSIRPKLGHHRAADHLMLDGTQYLAVYSSYGGDARGMRGGLNRAFPSEFPEVPKVGRFGCLLSTAARRGSAFIAPRPRGADRRRCSNGLLHVP